MAHATVADMSLESPAIVASGGSPGRLAATYTCDGKDSWPALHWGGVPAGTAELALFAMNVQPVEEKLFVDWAVAGIDPSLASIEADRLPKGAVVGTNSFGNRGYSICPPGAGEIYMFALYALPQSLSPQRGFDPRELRKEILAVSGNVGLLPTVYERG
ncbi:MAG TPA: YbhB/YbcL family Raf kinase inhibitor-like protein [Solirubrobacterales bacterium]|nr:YbhB/YbcL family Raf kinase inhibitor-like protein [Solirubrobacterales bacterium]